MESPPPAVFHDKAKRTQQGNLLGEGHVYDVGYVISDGRGGVHDGGGKRVGVWGGEDDPFARGGRGGDVETRV